MKAAPRLVTTRLILGCLIILVLQAMLSLYRQIQALDVVFTPSSQMWQLLVTMLLVCTLVLIILILTWTRHRRLILSLASRLLQLLPSARPIVFSLLIALILGFSLLVLFPLGKILGSPAFRWLAVGIVMILTLVLLRRLGPKLNWLDLFAITGLIVASGYRFFQFFPDISIYPFSLGWSEASRYYYASLFFSEKIYDLTISPSTLHPTRYLMQAVPFIIKALPLWFHRFWQVLLWLVSLFGTGILLTRRLKLSQKSWLWIFTSWTFLFLWQGPVYYHLLVMVMIILWGFDSQRSWRTLLIVILASIWAGLSRVNWFPVPGMLAAILFFLEQPFGSELLDSSPNKESSNIQPFRTTAQYLFQPFLWVAVGSLIALGSQSIYILWSANDPGQFASSFSSALLWYRLLPNSTNSLGILTATILISLPIVCLIGYRYRKRSVSLHLFGLLGICAILGVLLIGGLVVSVKIGGGSNLHNLDAYITMLLVVGSYYYFQRIPLLTRIGSQIPQVPSWINLLLVTIPVLFSLSSSSHFVQYNPKTAEESLFEMQKKINHALDDGGEILFISERHLLTFDYITGVNLIPEYEKVFLMEMAMAGNRTYLSAFNDDIRTQRFDLIITEPLFDKQKEKDESWAEENNVWVDAISVPILCHYRRKVTFPEASVQILEPRENSNHCINP